MIKTLIAKHRVARRCFLTGPVTAAYELKVDAGEVRRDDALRLDLLRRATPRQLALPVGLDPGQ